MRRIHHSYISERRRPDAAAYVVGSEKYKDIRGTVLFYRLEEGVMVRAEFTGLPKGIGPCASPVFAFHIHAGTACTGNAQDAFADAGMHYNPHNCRHPYHAGDMPPLFGANGTAFLAFLSDRFSISEILGKAVTVHANPDDFTTQPSGNSGKKLACGIIQPIRH